MKLCPKCDTEKSVMDFYQSTNSKDGLQRYCKTCQKSSTKSNPNYKANARRNTLAKKYGITPEDYENLLAIQNNSCGICKKPQLYDKQHRLAVDYDKISQSVRGLLCINCVIGLKNLDNPKVLEQAGDYLKQANLTIENRIRKILLNQMEDN